MPRSARPLPTSYAARTSDSSWPGAEPQKTATRRRSAAMADSVGPGLPGSLARHRADRTRFCCLLLGGACDTAAMGSADRKPSLEAPSLGFRRRRKDSPSVGEEPVADQPALADEDVRVAADSARPVVDDVPALADD